MNRNKSRLQHTLFLVLFLGGAVPPLVAQPLYNYELLPVPPGTTASEPQGISYHETGATGPKRYMVGGRVLDASGVTPVSRAVVWTQANNGTWGVQLLPVTNPSADSDNWSVDSFFDITYDIDFSVGSTGDPTTPGGQQPAAWTCTGDPCTWTAETVNIPAGFNGGAARRVVHFKPGTTLANKVCGVATDPSGGTKAVVWTRDAASLSWQPTLLPGLVNPDTGSHANSMAAPDWIGGTQVGWAIVGAATDAGGHQVPVRWSCNPSLDCNLTASWTVTALPMLPGGTQGEAVAMNRAELIETIASNQDVSAGGTTAKHAAVYTCDHGTDDCTLPSSWTAVELPPLGGYVNCYGFGIKEDGVNIVASGYSDNGAGTEIATDWIVDRTVSPPTVSALDLNKFVVNLPSNMVLTKKGEVKDVIKIKIIANKSLQARNAATFTGNAVVLTQLPSPIPTVTTWGLAVTALLVLFAGGVVLHRRRGMRQAV